MFEVKEEIKEYVNKNKSILKPIVILNLVRDIIEEMLSYNIPKKSILDYLNQQLQTDVKYNTFLSFVKKLDSYKNNKTNKFNKSSTKPNNFKKDNNFNPFEALKGLS